MAKVLGGYQPDTKAPSARRADFDQRRIQSELAAKTDGIEDDVTVMRDDVNAIQEDVLTVHDDIDALRVDIGEIEDAIAGTVWFSLALEGGWANFGSSYQTAQYRKVGDVVEVRGLIRYGTSLAAGSSSIFATVGGEFKPPVTEIFNQQTSVTVSSQAGRVDVDGNGLFTFWAPGVGVVNYLSLSGIRFSVTA